MHLLSIYMLAALLVADLGLISATIILMHWVAHVHRFGLWLANGRPNEIVQSETEIQNITMLSSSLSAIAVAFGLACLAAVADVIICSNVAKDDKILLPAVSMIMTAVLVIVAMIVAFSSIEVFKDLYRDFTSSWVMIGSLRRSYAAGEPELTEAMVRAQRKSLRNKKSELFVINKKTKRCEIPTRRIVR